MYQRAWKLHPDNLKALSRAREVYGELGRFEMVAKLGEMELRSPAAADVLPGIVGEALLDSGQKDKALPVLQRALQTTPDSLRVKDALAAASYDPEFWADEVERLTDEAERFDEATAVRMLVRAARILRLEAPEDARLEEILKRVLAKDIDEPSTNFLYETLLAGTNRWDELEAHHQRRADRAGEHGKKIEALRMFGLEWIQRFKDRDRGAKFFNAALHATVSNGAAPMRSVVAVFALLRQVQGDRGEWSTLLDVAEAILARPSGSFANEDLMYIAIQAGQIAFDKANDIARARKFFAYASRIEPQNPNVQDFVDAVGLDDAASAAAAAMPAPSAAARAVPPAVVEAPPVHAPAPVAAAPAPVVAAPAPVVAAPAPVHAPAPVAAAPAPVVDQPSASAPVAPAHVVDKPSGSAPVAAAPVTAAPAPAPVTAAPAPAPVVAAPAPAPAAAAPAPAAPLPQDLEGQMAAARSAEGGADRGVLAWKDVVAKHPQAREPRRELVRVLRAAQSWAQLADALKDEEAKAATSGPDKASVLLELADTYAKLNNDNQVMAALSSAMAQDPSGLEVYDRLGGLYEAKKRWPDLVKILLEKAERVPLEGEAGQPGKVDIYLQVANLYLERFSNQAEAIKAFERVLELDPYNQQAIDHLLAVYEKRRDWEKLIK
ncbi:MAG TPA: hypothetical protein VGC42_24435, partial [Kofleriaceae bacterium]